jgi:hypothetical protein
MAVRILHCGKSIDNYDLCLEHKVAGFTTRGPESGDTIFVAVRIKDKTVCGLKAKLAESTDFKPWEDGERYVTVFMLDEVTYANPFNIQFLSQVGGKHWNLKYLQGAKIIRDAAAVALLNEAFEANQGIRSIPDALLIIFNEKLQCPIQINLIEYECFGENKTRSQEKSNYLNGQIIPQLMKFASSFSIVTDRQIREQTIKSWVEKIILYVFEDEQRRTTFTSWIKALSPNLTDLLVGREIDRLLTESFRINLKIMLIIDDLSAEQKDTINNVIRAFRLENGESINFLAYVVRLEQKINVTDANAEYALSVQ